MNAFNPLVFAAPAYLNTAKTLSVSDLVVTGTDITCTVRFETGASLQVTATNESTGEPYVTSISAGIQVYLHDTHNMLPVELDDDMQRDIAFVIERQLIEQSKPAKDFLNDAHWPNTDTPACLPAVRLSSRAHDHYYGQG